MSTLVATFNQTTGWAGRTITYEEAQRQFILQDHGPITAQGALDYDTQGQIDWAREGLREWVRDFAAWESSPRPQAVVTSAPVEVSPAASTPGAEGPVCCPYCGVVLDPPPRATKKCPVCGEKMHLKTVAGTDERRLMTEADIAENDEAWGRYHFRKRAIWASEMIGCSEEDFLRTEQRLAGKWKTLPGPGDVFWSLANHAGVEAAAQGEWRHASNIYRNMGMWLYKERGESPVKLLREARIARLRDLASTNGKQARVRAFDCNDDEVCEACLSNRGKTWTVAEALDSPPVPHPDCANGLCRCSLDLVV
jgi:uncharacterized protein YkuJ